MAKPLRVRLLRALQFPFVLLAACVLWLEEWLWEPLSELMRRAGALPVIRNIESLIRNAPPWLALAYFAIPLVSLLPFKVAGLWLLGEGHVVLGVSMFLSAKIVGTALGARIFTLTQPALMRLAWFARLSSGFLRVKAHVYARVKRNALWRALRRAAFRIKAWFASCR
jgi:hypothetical protein